MHESSHGLGVNAGHTVLGTLSGPLGGVTCMLLSVHFLPLSVLGMSYHNLPPSFPPLLPPWPSFLPPSFPKEKARIHDYTFTLASNLSKKTSQLINTLTPPSSSKKRLSGEANAALSRVETTSAVMMAAKLLLSWLDRNPSNLLEDYDSFRTKILTSALDLASILV